MKQELVHVTNNVLVTLVMKHVSVLAINNVHVIQDMRLENVLVTKSVPV